MNEPEDLRERQCVPCSGDTPPLGDEHADRLLGKLDGWEKVDDRIGKTFSFKNYLRTMAFVNAVAWIAHRQNHHPDLEVSYDRCRVIYTTHAIGGLSENDFICAAKVDELLG